MTARPSRSLLPTPAKAATSRGLAVSPRRPWYDLSGIAALTILAATLSARFDVSESLLSWLHRRETLQMDELPGVLLVLCLALLWFAWRRYHDLQHVVRAHEVAEVLLANQLERNRALHAELLQVQEQERRTLAHELHDELGQYLGALRFDLHALAGGGSMPVLEREGLFDRARSTLDHLQGTVRHLIGQLRPSALDELGLEAALDQLVNGWQLRLPDTRLILSCSGLPLVLDEAQAITVFRLTQEALTNLARHARAGEARISLQIATLNAADQRQTLQWQVEDDGIGFDPTAPRTGLGLISMAERVQTLGGMFHCEAAPGQGCLLQARWPT